MAYIKDFAVKNLKKNAVVEFFEYLMSLIELCQSLKTNLPEQYAAIKTAVAEVQKWSELTLKSNLTNKIHDLDSQRDSFLVALENALKALVKSLDPEIKEKATIVQNKYNSINVPRSAQYFQESGAIDRLLGALLGEELLQDVTAIGVLPLVNMLKDANDEMHRLLLERGIDEAQVPEQAFEKARRAAEAVYRDFVFMVNAYIAMYVERAGQTDAGLETFVLNLNQFLHKYKITQFKSASKSEDAIIPPSSDDSENDDNNTTNPGDDNNNTNPGGGENTNPGGGENTNPGGGENTNPGGGENTNPGGGENTNPGTGGESSDKVTVTFHFENGGTETREYPKGTILRPGGTNYPANTPGYNWSILNVTLNSDTNAWEVSEGDSGLD